MTLTVTDQEEFQVNVAVHGINMIKLYLRKQIVDFSWF